MTQSKDNDFNINLDDLDISEMVTNDTITINLDDYQSETFDTTTTMWSSPIISDSTFTVSTESVNAVDIDWIYNNMNIDPCEVERMCKEYPSLEKVWRNFKSVYDMVKQDYEGKKKAGEIDDDIPF